MTKTIRRTTTCSPSADAFRAEAAEALDRLIQTTRELVGAVPGRPATAAALARAIRITPKAGWQLTRLARAAEPLGAVAFLPGTKPFRDAVQHARASGVSHKIADAARDAYIALDDLIGRTAGNPQAFVSMLADVRRRSHGAADTDRRQRVAAFRAFTHFCGMNVELAQDINIISDVADDRRRNVSMRTVRGLRRLRSDAQCVVDSHLSERSGPDAPHPVKGALDRAAFRESGVPVLPQFCSRPMPELVINYDDPTDPNRMFVEWAGDRVGLAAAVDVATGFVDEVPITAPRDGGERRMRFTTQVGYPARLLTHTWLIRLSGRTLGTPRLTGYLDPMSLVNDADARRSPPLYVGDVLTCWPAGAWNDLPRDRGVDREQITYACACMGWDPSEFAIYSLRIEYPLMHSALAVEFPWN